MYTIEDIHSVIASEFCGGIVTKDTKKPDHKRTSWDEAKKKPYVFFIVPEHILVTDYDNQEAFEARLKIAKAKNEHCIVIKSISRGGHFIWYNKKRQIVKSTSHNMTLLTLPDVDYKSGIKIVKSTGEITTANNAICLSLPMPDDNTKRAPFREVVYCNLNEDGTLDEIPFYDLPLKTQYKSFLGLKSGDGRNDLMRDYMYPFSEVIKDKENDKFKQAAEIINKYIMSEPFDESELETVTRQELWDGVLSKVSFYEGRSFRHDKLAEYIKQNFNIKQINHQLHIFKDGVYIPSISVIEGAINGVAPQLKSHQRTEVIKSLSLICDNMTIDDSSAHLIAFRNGIYDLDTDTLKPFSPDIVITNMIPWDYNAEAYSELADKTLNKVACNNPQIRLLLEECIGSCFYRSNKLGRGKCFILTGGGHNGKSTYLEVLQKILSEDQISSLDIKELSEKFQNAELFGKLANIGDDIGNEFIPNPAIFKKLVTGNRVQVQRKGERPFEFNNYAKLLFSANDIPRIKDSTGAVQNRLLIIPFNAVFSVNDPDYDENIAWKLKEQKSIEYFIKVGIEGLKRVRHNQDYTKSDTVEAAMKEYEVENNPILAFFNEISVEDIKRKTTKEVYLKYTVFCNDNNYKEMGEKKFGKKVRERYNVKSEARTINGKSVRIYI